MKNVILNCEKLLRREQAHLYLAQMLDFPDYYGKNLDALFDCLTELGECTIILEGGNILQQSAGYGAKVLKVFEEAVQHNPRLRLKVQEAEVYEPRTAHEDNATS